MKRIRLLIVDDSVVVRKLVSDTVSEDPDIEVVGVAANGKIALSKVEQLTPDVVTLDIEMPEMNGLEALKVIKKNFPKVRVVMFSTLTDRGAASTLEALSLGADDYVTKPANVGSVMAGKEAIREQLVPKLRALSGFSPSASPATPSAKPLTKTPARAAKAVPAGLPSKIDIVAIGVSTGGPNALDAVIPPLPEHFPVPIVIVQHMPPIFTKSLADRLNGRSQVEVLEGSDGAEVRAGQVIIAPGDYHMTVVKRGSSLVLKMNQNTPENSCRPAADVLFRSVAEVFGGRALGLVMTGMGQDGFKGAEVMAQSGARILAQDKETSVVWGMPSFVANAGLAEKVLPLGEIAGELTRRASVGRVLKK